MLVSVIVGEHEVPGSAIPVVPGDVHVRAPVCRPCYEERMKDDGND